MSDKKLTAIIYVYDDGTIETEVKNEESPSTPIPDAPQTEADSGGNNPPPPHDP